MHICFLDIDGTLVTTGGAGQAAFVVTLTEDFGIDNVTSADVAFAGRSDRAITMDFFAVHGIEPSPENWRRFCLAYVRRLEQVLPAHQGRVLPGVSRLLQSLQQRGDVALGLLTGNVREGARRKLGYFGLWEWFPFGGFGDDHTERDAIAATALAAARDHLKRLPRSQLQPARTSTPPLPIGDAQQVVVIGDTLHDIRCGRAIGARCVAVPTGQVSAELLRSGQPDLLVESLEDADAVLQLFE